MAASRSLKFTGTPFLLSALSLHFAIAFTSLFHPAAAWAQNPDFTTPIAPFQIADNLYYVGSRDLAAYLVVTKKGDILINANLISSPKQIEQSIEKLGFAMSDIKVLLISHAHADHAGGSAEVLRLSGARYEVMDSDVPIIESGGSLDFAYPSMRYPPVKVTRVLHDGDEVRLGDARLVAHKTPGHTPGCTTWTMTTKLAGTPRTVVIVGGWSINPDYRLVSGAKGRASYPTIAQDYERGFAVLDKLPCDIFLGAHGRYFGLLEKLQRATLDHNISVWLDPDGYRIALAKQRKVFQDQLVREQAAP